MTTRKERNLAPIVDGYIETLQLLDTGRDALQDCPPANALGHWRRNGLIALAAATVCFGSAGLVVACLQRMKRESRRYQEWKHR